MEQLGLFDRPAGKPKRPRKPKPKKLAVEAQAGPPLLDAYVADRIGLVREWSTYEREDWRDEDIRRNMVRAASALVGWLTGSTWENATQCTTDLGEPEDEAPIAPHVVDREHRMPCYRCGADEAHNCVCYMAECHDPTCACIERHDQLSRGKKVGVIEIATPRRCSCSRPARVGPLFRASRYPHPTCSRCSKLLWACHCDPDDDLEGRSAA